MMSGGEEGGGFERKGQHLEKQIWTTIQVLVPVPGAKLNVLLDEGKKRSWSRNEGQIIKGFHASLPSLGLILRGAPSCDVCSCDDVRLFWKVLAAYKMVPGFPGKGLLPVVGLWL